MEGYEIHMGDTRSGLPAMCEIKDCAGKQTASQRTRQSMDGVSMGNVYGTYIHGIFDREDVVTAVDRALAARKGMILDDLKAVDLKDFKERQYDLLADGLRSHLDMKKIYEILEGGI